MIYPAPRTVLLTALGAPAAVVIGVLVPQYWTLGLGWAVLIFVLFAIDAALALPNSRLSIDIERPGTIAVGAPFMITLHAQVARGGGAVPAVIEAALSVDDRLDGRGARFERITLFERRGECDLDFTAGRRGLARIDTLWLRWRGPLGLAWRQRVEPLGIEIPVLPGIARLQDRSIRLDLRDAPIGLIAQPDRGEGSEFDALTEFAPGMDRRTIDWKQSARHTQLLAKEFRSERNNQIVFALDAGRTMCEPLEGLPRLDRAISAALLTGWTALKAGDRVGLFGFADRPMPASPIASGTAAFPVLQASAAAIDYRPEESNYTLALVTLAAQLKRRSMVVFFTDFADPTSAALMLKAARPLLDRHIVLFVVMRDEELNDFVEREPGDPLDVPRAVAAAALLRQRALVIARLRHLGAHVLDVPHREIAARLIDSYVELKRRSLV